MFLRFGIVFLIFLSMKIFEKVFRQALARLNLPVTFFKREYHKKTNSGTNRST